MEFDKMRFYLLDNRLNGWWCSYFKEFDIEVNIQGNELEPERKWIDYASEILQYYYNEINDLAKSRLKEWANPTANNFKVLSIYFGEYTYGPEQTLRSGIKLTLQTKGDIFEDNCLFTVNFTEKRWPIGFEFSLW